MPVNPKNFANALARSTSFGIQTFFSFVRSLNPIDHDWNIVFIDEVDYEVAISSSSRGSELYYRAWLTNVLTNTLGDSSADEAYSTLVKQESQINNMTLWSSEKIQDAITSAIEVERKLIKISASVNEQGNTSKTTTENPSDNTAETDTEANTENNTDNSESTSSTTMNDLKTSSKYIDWNTFFSVMVSPEYASSTSAVIFLSEHLKLIDELIESTSVKVLQEYWIVQTVAQMANKIKIPTGQEAEVSTGVKEPQPEFDATYTNEPEQDTAQMICGKETSKTFYNLIGRFFSLATFGTSKEKEGADQFIDNIYQTWLAALPSTDWIDDATKVKVIEKIKALRIRVAYSTTVVDWRDPSSIEAYYSGVETSKEYLENLYYTTAWKNAKIWKALETKIDPDEWSEDNYPEQINAFYDPNSNMIEIPIGNFRRPFYSPDYPQYLNYGNLGSTIGHELVHSLDNSGRLFDPKGYQVDWFSKNSSDAYQAKSQCFIDQFSAFSLSGPDDTRIHLDGSFVLGENIADSGGIHIAFSSYQKYLEKTGITEQTLPGFENNTPDQLYFVSNAIFTCSNVQKSLAQQIISTDVHAPLYFRNIGGFQNSIEFAKAFNCPAKSPMNPETKCSIW